MNKPPRLLSKVLALTLLLCVVMAGSAFTAEAATSDVTFYDMKDGPIVITSPGNYTIMGYYDDVFTAITATVDCHITLYNVHIDLSSYENEAAMEITNGASVTLALYGPNELSSGSARSGIENDGADVSIYGTGSLRVSGLIGIGYLYGSGRITIDSGYIEAYGADTAIGSSEGFSGGVDINGGTVEAYGWNGIAVGYTGDINVNEANVTATNFLCNYGRIYINSGAYVMTEEFICYRSSIPNFLYIDADATVIYI